MRRYKRRPPHIGERIAALLGEHPDGMDTRSVAYLLNMSVPEASRRLYNMYRAGMVERVKGRSIWRKV